MVGHQPGIGLILFPVKLLLSYNVNACRGHFPSLSSPSSPCYLLSDPVSKQILRTILTKTKDYKGNARIVTCAPESFDFLPSCNPQEVDCLKSRLMANLFYYFFGCQRISVLLFHNSTNKSGIWFTFIALHWNSHLLCISLNCP